ncbi:hypothetical protein QFZ79_000562 [Arthrobacter sp. V4I6]|uniref:hypothetical protein n=1 Tax=unclassified Arthrobacter TaxID=235627 RepID=UPI00277DCEF2|nr:hypothetical protein [Arthrobacter sp. V1I7]MDQ0852451.1 hypothetical protein [Arthrobacter sp. V4I6]
MDVVQPAAAGALPPAPVPAPSWYLSTSRVTAAPSSSAKAARSAAVRNMISPSMAKVASFCLAAVAPLPGSRERCEFAGNFRRNRTVSSEFGEAAAGAPGGWSGRRRAGRATAETAGRTAPSRMDP